jgi:lysophospholipase L1-like esterase
MNIDFRLVLVGVLLIGVLLFASLSYTLIKRNRHLTRDLARTRLDPLGIDDFNDQLLLNKDMAHTTVLFFGDSRAAAWPNPEMDDSFAFVNRGINGQSSAQVAQRFDAHVAPVQPDVVVVQVCVNDLWRIPVFPDEKKAIIQACQENIKQIVEQSKAVGATVILTTIFPVQDPPFMQRMYWSADVYDGIDAVNESIRAMAERDVVVMDAYGLLVDENGRLQDQYAADYLHINEAGYQLLNKSLTELLELTAAP